MKALVCEMCNSNDMVKQDGYIVCQHCGMKYSIEEAKKMMVEGPVEVEGSVQIKNAAQVENLWQLACSSYLSKNYVQAESFCNQIIAIDALHYNAWKLKGEAINYQITGTNDRIEEVFICIMTSYKLLPEDEKASRRDEIITSLRTCLEGEIDFALKLFQENRPSKNGFDKVKKAFLESTASMVTCYKELGYGEEVANKYRTNSQKEFIRKVNDVCVNLWKNVVYYNYRRNGFTQEYHPTKEIFYTFIDECGVLISLLEFASKHYSSGMGLNLLRDNYTLQILIHKILIDSWSYKLMVNTTTNGYGAVLSRHETWEKDVSLTEDAKNVRKTLICRLNELLDNAELEEYRHNPSIGNELVKRWKNELNGLDLSYRIPEKRLPACWITGIWVLVCFVVEFLVWDEPIWFWSMMPLSAFGLLFFVIAFTFAHKEAKAELEENQAIKKRLLNKIKQVAGGNESN